LQKIGENVLNISRHLAVDYLHTRIGGCVGAREHPEIGNIGASESFSFGIDFETQLKFFACSFAEGEDEWKDGIDVLEYDDNFFDLWNSPKVHRWGKRLIENGRSCPIYNLDKECGTKEELLENLKNYIKMHQKGDPGIVGGGDEAKLWGNPYCYIINIKNNEKLFGAMINKEKLEFETNIYTVYK